MTPPTEAQAPTPEPSEEDRELRSLLERAKPHASSHELVYGHRGIIGELTDALEARALSPSPDTRMGEVLRLRKAAERTNITGGGWCVHDTHFFDWLAEHMGPENIAYLRACVLNADATTRLAASSREGGEELLGEAMFVLSGRLRASGFLDDDANHAAYEKVVAAFQSLASPADDTDLLRKLHDAMSEIMELRRLSSTIWEQKKAEAAIAVWRKVDAHLKVLASPAPMPETEGEQVTQGDRDMLARLLGGRQLDPVHCESIRRGGWDSTPEMRLVSAHRRAALQSKADDL